jgi:hypothetical protein
MIGSTIKFDVAEEYKGSSTAQQNSDKMTSDVLKRHLVSVVVIGSASS